MVQPRVSIGMPVYNGERYVAEALESLITQTFSDFELVIADNASTDRTEAICRSYARRDDRVRYVRNRANYGAIYNFNNVFRLTTGEYFKWAAYDDVCDATFLSRCVEVLDQDPGVVLACPRVVGIDEEGHPTDIVTRPGHGRDLVTGVRLDIDPAVSPSDPDPVQRWRFMMRYLWWTPHLYGLIRADVMSKTDLHPFHFNGDHILLAELALLGRFHEIPDELLPHQAPHGENLADEWRRTKARGCPPTPRQEPDVACDPSRAGLSGTVHRSRRKHPESTSDEVAATGLRLRTAGHCDPMGADARWVAAPTVRLRTPRCQLTAVRGARRPTWRVQRFPQRAPVILSSMYVRPPMLSGHELPQLSQP